MAGNEFLQESECAENPYAQYMDDNGSMINNPKKPVSNSGTGDGGILINSDSSKKKPSGSGLGQRLSTMFGLSGSSRTVHYTITIPWCTQWHADDFMEVMPTPDAVGMFALADITAGSTGSCNGSSSSTHISDMNSDRQRITKLLLLQKSSMDPHLRSRSHIVGLECAQSKFGERFEHIKSHRTRRILSILQQLLPYTQ
jgi:hypothetical protein